MLYVVWWCDLSIFLNSIQVFPFIKKKLKLFDLLIFKVAVTLTWKIEFWEKPVYKILLVYFKTRALKSYSKSHNSINFAYFSKIWKTCSPDVVFLENVKRKNVNDDLISISEAYSSISSISRSILFRNRILH